MLFERLECGLRVIPSGWGLHHDERHDFVVLLFLLIFSLGLVSSVNLLSESTSSYPVPPLLSYI